MQKKSNGPSWFLSKEQMAALLKTSPEALKAFEESYQSLLDEERPETLFETNSRQAAENVKNDPVSDDALAEVCKRCTAELAGQTKVCIFDGERKGRWESRKAIPDQEMLTREELSAIPEPQRPSLSGKYMRRDFAPEASAMILYFYQRYLEERNPEKKMQFYHHFRQGLDIKDLDPIMYAMLGTNPASMGHWLPELVEANKGLGFFRIPKTRVATVPLPILQLTRLDYDSLNAATRKIVNDWAKEVFRLDQRPKDGFFVKTGTYSSKFDFRNARVTDPAEIDEIGEYLTFIQYQAQQMAGPLCKPCIYGVSTTNEWVVREYIPDREGNPTIYKGLPLRTEYRVFLDCDRDEVFGIVPYWEPETMKRRFSHGNDKDSPHQVHDYMIYLAHEDVLMRRYNMNYALVADKAAEFLPWLNLKGQWSLDVMQNGDEFWLIDMAPAELSAFYRETVPEEKRRPMEEDWLPKLPRPEGKE